MAWVSPILIIKLQNNLGAERFLSAFRGYNQKSGFLVIFLTLVKTPTAKRKVSGGHFYLKLKLKYENSIYHIKKYSFSE